MSATTFTAVRDAAYDEAYRNRYIIAITVTFASILEILDTSIVNVAPSQTVRTTNDCPTHPPRR